MELAVGTTLPAPQSSQRLRNQIGPFESALRSLSRRKARRAGPEILPTAPTADGSFDGSTRAYFERSLAAELRGVQRELQSRTGVRVNIAAARSEIVAKTASRLGPRGDSCVIPAGREREFLSSLPLESLYGLPHSSLSQLRATGLVTIGELQRVPKAALQAMFGVSAGTLLWRSARGLDTPTPSRPETSAVPPSPGVEAHLLAGSIRRSPRWTFALGFVELTRLRALVRRSTLAGLARRLRRIRSLGEV